MGLVQESRPFAARSCRRVARFRCHDPTLTSWGHLVRRLIGAAAAATLLLTGLAVPAAIAAPPDGMPVADFAWSMAERTRGITNTGFKPDLNVDHLMIEGPVAGQPGLYGGVSSVPLDEINPADGYEVTLDGCGSTGNITQYDWRIDGVREAKGKECSLTTKLQEGDYLVSLAVNGGGRVSTLEQTITVKDYVVVSMGDSYSSGEGNPTQYDPSQPDSTLDEALADNGLGWSEGGKWDYANCHRSTRSGQANAAVDAERADPHSSITFIYVACSGAQIENGILGIKDGNLGGAEVPQAKQAHDLVIANGRDIDAVVLGIGGNDIGFVPIVAEGIIQVDAFLSTQALPGFGVPDLPVVEPDAIIPAQVGDLTLKPDPSFPNLDPGPPYLTLQPETLHSCDSVYQEAVLGNGGIGGAEACRESIGTQPAGLAQVDQCLTGDGASDCVSVPSYYDFDTGQYKYPGGETWQGLGVDPDRVFYTEYPDLTTTFANPITKELEYCQISFTKEQLIAFLEAIKGYLDDPTIIDTLIALLQPLALPNLGLTQNEFAWAAEAVLGGIDNPQARVLLSELSGKWNVKAPGGPFAKTTIGLGETIDYVNLGTQSPALGEITRLSQMYYGWTPVLGTFDLASGHGLCNFQPGTVPDAVAAYAYLVGPLQGTNASGSAHPNMLGHEIAYRGPVSTSLIAGLGL